MTFNRSTGNLSIKAGISYTYDTTHKHAATAWNGWAYTYDNNGNMLTRAYGVPTYTLTYDAENHLVSVSGAATATFVYDGDGNRVKGTIGGVTTTYIGNPSVPSGQGYAEWISGSPGSLVKYYYAGNIRVAMKDSALKYLLGDHLGSQAITANSSGSKTAEVRYYPWGTDRYTYGTTPTTYRFTGQRAESGIGLYYYGARWYDAYLNRWISPDSIIPDPYNPQDWDRYSYARNNPVRYTDPSGHVTTDDCGPDGIYCQNNPVIQWDPETDPGLDKNDQALAEQTYLHALEDPGYFISLYFNTNGNLWNSDVVNYLDIYCQYSNLHMTAEEFILAGMDIQAARISRMFYNSGNTDMGDAHLLNALAPLAAGVVPLGLGHTGRYIPKNPLEQAAMDKLQSDPLKYGKPITGMRVLDDRWPWESGWVKMRAKINGVEIHFLYNPLTTDYDDFKYP